MTANRPELTDEQFEQLLIRTGRQLSLPPMRDSTQAALTRIRSEQELAGQPATNNQSPLRGPWDGPVTSPPVSSAPAAIDPPRSRWREAALLAGGIAAGAAIALVLLLVFRGIDTGDGTGDRAPGAAPTVEFVAFSDPALAASVLMIRSDADAGSVVLPVDPSTGEAIPGYTPIVGTFPGLDPEKATTADRSAFVTIESHGRVCEPSAGGTACRSSADALHLVDVASWTERTVELPGDSWENGIDFSHDGRYFAIALTSPAEIGMAGATRLMVFDTVSLNLVAERVIDFRPSLVEFALDDTALAVYGLQLGDIPGVDRPGPAQLVVLDAVTLDPVRELSFESLLSGFWCVVNCSGSHEERDSVGWTPGVILSLDGRDLLIVHADQDALTKVDLEAGEVSELELREDEAWINRLSALFVSEATAKGDVDGTVRELRWPANGDRLYVLTSTTNSTRDPEDDESSLHLIDPGTGRVLEQRSIDPASFVSLPPDTQEVLVTGPDSLASQAEPWTEALDAETLQPLYRLDGWRMAGAHTLAGQPVLLAEIQGEDGIAIALIDAETNDIIGIWATEPGRCSLVLDAPVCQGD